MLRRREKRWAAIFADDLLAGCDDLLEAHGGGESVAVPISIPIDAGGVVLLRPDGPLDAPRVPAILHVERMGPGHHVIAIERQDGGPLVIPGLHGDGTGIPSTVVADVNGRGMVLTDGAGPLQADEDTARSYANALFLTLQRKLSGARPTSPQTRKP